LSSQAIKLDLQSALHHLAEFLTIHKVHKDIFLRDIEDAVNIATFKLLQYRSKYGVGMEKEELLRDIVFLGSALYERHPDNPMYYKATVKACAALIENTTGKTFDIKFIEKLLKAYSSFYCNRTFNSDILYFIFKTHFRIS
jgi:hypothetical protein